MDSVTLVKREVQAQEWSARIQECRESGMSVKAWCRKNGINPKTYYYHLRMSRGEYNEQIPVAISTVTENKNTDAVITVCCSGIRVEIHASAPTEGIEAVIRALKC